VADDEPVILYYVSLRGGGAFKTNPVKAQLRSGGHELIIIYGLDHVAVGEVGVCIYAVFVLIGRSENETTGRCLVRSSARIALRTSMPLIFGMLISRSVTAGRSPTFRPA